MENNIIESAVQAVANMSVKELTQELLEQEEIILEAMSEHPEKSIYLRERFFSIRAILHNINK